VDDAPAVHIVKFEENNLTGAARVEHHRFCNSLETNNREADNEW
jgi:hypothetical protein